MEERIKALEKMAGRQAYLEAICREAQHIALAAVLISVLAALGVVITLVL